LIAMSRAFVKETEDLPELPDRPLSPHPNLVTERGLALIEAEVEKNRRALAEAQKEADRDRIASISRELRYWSARRATAEVQPAPTDSESVRFGSTVTVKRNDGRKQTFRIVGEDEADPAAGSLSYASPLARALIGKEEGDTVRVGEGEAEILAIGT
jgi:transcription elongation GreA/GreB family factor